MNADSGIKIRKILKNLNLMKTNTLFMQFLINDILDYC